MSATSMVRNEWPYMLAILALSRAAFGQAPIEPIKTTLCDLVNHPTLYSGKVVRLRATVDAAFEMSSLSDDGPDKNCSDRVWFEWPGDDHGITATEGAVEYTDVHSAKELDRPDRLSWHSIPHLELVRDQAFLELRHYLSQVYRPRNPKVICWDCSLYTVTATITGRFDYAKGYLRAVRGSSKNILAVGSVRFGNLGQWDSELVFLAVSDVVAKPTAFLKVAEADDSRDLTVDALPLPPVIPAPAPPVINTLPALTVAVLVSENAEMPLLMQTPQPDPAAQRLSTQPDARTPDEPIKTTLCELVKSPDRFNGKLVQVRGIVRSGFEIQHLMDASCEAYIWLYFPSGTSSKADEEDVVAYAYIISRTEIAHPEKLDWKPVEELRPITQHENEASRKLLHYIGQFYGPKGVKGRCHDSPTSCPAFTVEATLTGRFDHRELRMRAIRLQDHPGQAYFSMGGFGHLYSYESQLAVESVSDVDAKPIPLSTYGKRE